MIRSQIKKYPRKVFSFGKRIIKKIYSITEMNQDAHVHIQKQTSENSHERTSEQTENPSLPKHYIHEEVQTDSVQENLQKEDFDQSKNIPEKIEQENKETQEKSSSIKTVDSVASLQDPDSSTDEKKSSLETELLIDPEPTPNPNCYKFTLNTNIGRSFSCSPTENSTHHIGAPLLAIDGIVSVFGVNNFLVMNKEVDRNWDDLVEPVVEKIEEVLG